MGALDFNVESYDGSRPGGMRWVNHFTNHNEVKTMKKMERMSAAYPDVLFRVSQTPAREKIMTPSQVINHILAGQNLTPAAAHTFTLAEVEAFQSGARSVMPVYQWESPSRGWRPRTAKTKDGELITIGNLATLDTYRRTSFKVGLFQAVMTRFPFHHEDNIYLLNGRFIDKSSSDSYIHEHTQAAKARARWIMPDGGIKGVKHINSCLDTESLNRLWGLYVELKIDLELVLKQGNLSQTQRAALEQVKLLTGAAAQALDDQVTGG